MDRRKPYTIAISPPFVGMGAVKCQVPIPRLVKTKIVFFLGGGGGTGLIHMKLNKNARMDLDSGGSYQTA